ncbi:alkene reductase [Thiomicrorhabdus lithotrophica]|uniref:Alkene reductase n=1 Tax=Thiomicrorhabdus lithotrophica TaxID=2949997 RepID=A0ABY8C9Z0_9GAMM|nr:alkene reductase [Thiomicrorhabdus lithotrophica]WEJ61627.1 alkene reductase [Thiomicrorhabdus lithotrophica]
MQNPYPHLFTPVKLGAIELKNRIIMAPLTRARTEVDHIPTDLMAEHYAQRASGGLIIAEATMAMEGCSSFWKEPGIYSDAQIAGWKKVTDAVHAKGGKIVLQIWHGGRTCHPALNNGKTPVAPSAIAVEDEVHTPEGKLPYTVPHALTLEEIPEIIEGFKQAAINAKTAGFDGVEVHGANGYLLDQFLRDGSNQRTDSYGGSIENRARLLLEVLTSVTEVWGSERVGLRISPVNSYNSMIDSDPVELTKCLCKKLNDFNLAYLHVMRSDFFGVQQQDVISAAEENYQGNLMGNMGYDASEAEAVIAKGKQAAVAFGVIYLANPDLPERFKAGAELNEANPDTFYTPGAEGYTDYPFMKA